jgi:hypothetical protein
MDRYYVGDLIVKYALRNMVETCLAGRYAFDKIW